MKQVDILIVGGGMVGLSFAAALQQFDATKTLSVAVIDGRPFSPSDSPASQLRVSAITRASEQFLTALDAWPSVANTSAYDRMQVWDATGSGEINFDAAELAEPNLGHIVANEALRTALIASLARYSNIELLAPVTADKLELNITEDLHQLQLTNGQSLQAKLIIAADGGNSWVREQCNMPVSVEAYDQSALVCQISTEQAHQYCARQAFLATGPLALLPLTDEHLCSIVWSTTEQHAAELKAMQPQAFNQALTEASAGALGQLSLDSERFVFPLIRRHAQQYLKDGIALIGDAAHTIHPLAGQGVNLGFMDAATLAEVLAGALTKGHSLHNAKALRAYERWRKSENQLMVDAMALFRQLFEGETGLKPLVRNYGLSTVDKLPLVKSQIIEHAMGLKGDLPKLALS